MWYIWKMGEYKIMIKVLYEDNHLLVVEKPVNILSQGDNKIGRAHV